MLSMAVAYVFGLAVAHRKGATTEGEPSRRVRPATPPPPSWNNTILAPAAAYPAKMDRCPIQLSTKYNPLRVGRSAYCSTSWIGAGPALWIAPRLFSSKELIPPLMLDGTGFTVRMSSPVAL